MIVSPCSFVFWFFIKTRIMADIQHNLQEIRETAVIASTCLSLSLGPLTRVHGMLCNSIQ